jgi:crotonobetainyl-CoA:carnitine CoA-transferase CaiB-like acyl-CoA transferase
MAVAVVVEVAMVQSPSTPIRLDGQANGVRMPPPRLGADTEAVLREWLGGSVPRLDEREPAESTALARTNRIPTE